MSLVDHKCSLFVAWKIRLNLHFVPNIEEKAKKINYFIYYNSDVFYNHKTK